MDGARARQGEINTRPQTFFNAGAHRVALDLKTFGVSTEELPIAALHRTHGE